MYKQDSDFFKQYKEAKKSGLIKQKESREQNQEIENFLKLLEIIPTEETRDEEAGAVTALIDYLQKLSFKLNKYLYGTTIKNAHEIIRALRNQYYVLPELDEAKRFEILGKNDAKSMLIVEISMLNEMYQVLIRNIENL